MEKKVIITIARGFGSYGKTIGKRLSEELQIPYYDRDLLRMASEESGIHERLFGKADEKVKPSLFRRTGVYQGEVLPPDSNEFVSDDNLFNFQAKVIKELAQRGSCIIVGRCADFVLKDRTDVVRVFVWATRESCIQTVMKLYGLDRKDAERTIEKTDKNRSTYYRYYVGREWDNARNYDLCLNSSDLGLEKCVQIIKDYVAIKNS